VITCEIFYLMNFGFSNITWINSGQTSAFIMHFEHDCSGLFAPHLKKPFKYMNDKFHWCEIVIQK